MAKTPRDLRGIKFGKLNPLKYEPGYKDGDKTISARWICSCDCGGFRKVSTKELNKGSVTSCGCDYRGSTYKHGLSKTKAYGVWRNMKARCDDSRRKDYRRYGARGIGYNRSWEDFENFYADMGDVPEGMTLDRINNDEGYSKSNCRWATIEVQSRNKAPLKQGNPYKTGVTWRKERDKWVVNLSHQGRKIYIGSFFYYDDAVKAMREAEVEYLGFNLLH